MFTQKLSQLKQLEATPKRILTASILLPLTLSWILLFPTNAYTVVSVAILFLAGLEWSGLLKLGPLYRMFFQLWLLFWFYKVALGLRYWDLIPFYKITAYFWLASFVLLLLYPRGTKIWANPWGFAILSIPVLIPFWMALLYLRTNMIYPIAPLLYVLILIWTSDSAAYFIGKRYGRHKLAPQISPNKTWEGLIGGVVVAALLGLALIKLPYFNFLHDSRIIWVILATLIAGVQGDLFESMLKRVCQVKDSGSIFPGHGGLLDRLDSLTAALPMFALGLHLLRIL